MHVEELPIRCSEDIVRVRQAVRRRAIASGLNLVEQTKVVTAASEIARNTFEHGGGGTATIRFLFKGSRSGLQICFEDSGPGIPNVEMAMRDGYTTRAGLGLGLGGAKRLCSEFEIHSHPGAGTRVTLTQWKL